MGVHWNHVRLTCGGAIVKSSSITQTVYKTNESKYFWLAADVTADAEDSPSKNGRKMMKILISSLVRLKNLRKRVQCGERQSGGGGDWKRATYCWWHAKWLWLVRCLMDCMNNCRCEWPFLRIQSVMNQPMIRREEGIEISYDLSLFSWNQRASNVIKTSYAQSFVNLCHEYTWKCGIKSVLKCWTNRILTLNVVVKWWLYEIVEFVLDAIVVIP